MRLEIASRLKRQATRSFCFPCGDVEMMRRRMSGDSKMRGTIATARAMAGTSGASLNHLRLSAGEMGAAIFDRPQTVLFIIIVALFIGLRLWQLTSFGLFGDETFTVNVSTSNWGELIDKVVADIVHPPLFYILLKVWILIGGQSELWLKLLPCLTSIVAIAPFFLLCRELRLAPAAVNLALALMAVNAYLVYHAQDLRMYSLVMMFTLTSLWLFARLFNSPHSSLNLHACLMIANLLLVYTHYYGWLIVGVEFLFLLLWGRGKLKAFSLALIALLASFSPWAYAVSQAAVKKGGLAGNLGWNRPPDFEHFTVYFAMLAGGLEERWKYFGAYLDRMVSIFPKVAFLFALPVLLWCWHALAGTKTKGKSQSITFWWLAMLSFLPAVIAFWASQVSPQSIWAARYLIISAPPFMMLLAIACMKLGLNWLRSSIAILLFGWCALSGIVQMSHRDMVAYQPIVRRLIASESGQPIAKIYTDNYNMASTFNFYLERVNDKKINAVWVNDYAEAVGDSFRVAFMKYAPEAQEEIEAVFKNRGYETREEMKVEAFTYEVVLLVVERPQTVH
jgi:hypothetical protein